MFGYVQANLNDLSEKEQARYRAAYCGLCRALGQRHGLSTRMALTYDLTFLALFLSSLYEPEEQTGTTRCVVHPCKAHPYLVTEYTEYAADMTVALTYHKCLDDWQDDKNAAKKAFAAWLRPKYREVKKLWPQQCRIIEGCLQQLTVLERDNVQDPDAAAACFGRLMECLFLYREDRWSAPLRQLGYGLGRYIYLVDAALDLEEDRKKGRYNPLSQLAVTPQTIRPTLMSILGEAADGFEELPLVQDVHLLRNILYSGLWVTYNRQMQKEKKVQE